MPQDTGVSCMTQHQMGRERMPHETQVWIGFPRSVYSVWVQSGFLACPKKQMKCDRTTEPNQASFLGTYPSRLPLKQLNDASFDELVTVLRVLKVIVPERIEYPCRLRADAIPEGRISPDQLVDGDADELPPPENQDAQPVREPE